MRPPVLSAPDGAAATPPRPASSRCALGAVALVAALALAGCAAPAPPPTADTGPGRYGTAGVPPYQATRPPPQIAPLPPAVAPVDARMKVALLLPLTGQHAAIGSAMLDAAQLAVFDLGGDNFEMIPKDTRGTPEGAARAASEAVAEGVDLILGPLLAPSVRAATPAARAANVPILAFSNDRTVAGGGVFTLGFLPGPEVRRVVDHAVRQGMRRFAAVAPETPYGRLTVDELQDAVAAHGAELVSTEFVSPGAGLPQITEIVQRLGMAGSPGASLSGVGLSGAGSARSGGVDAVLLPMIGPMLTATASTLAFQQLDPAQVRYLGTGQWDQLDLSQEPALVGSWYAAPDPAARAPFERKFRDAYGSEPPRLATLAYDAMALAAVLSSRSDPGAFSQQMLTDLEGFTGTDGLFRFRPDGTAERGLAVLQVTPSGVVVAEPAPNRFDDRIF